MAQRKKKVSKKTGRPVGRPPGSRSVGRPRKVVEAPEQDIRGFNPLEVGNNVFVQTVTFAYLGKVKAVTKEALILEEVSWVSDTHRFSTFLAQGPQQESEIEKFPEGMDSRIERATIVNSVKWPHPLPTENI